MRILLLAIVVIAVTGACGQKGPLMITEPPVAPAAVPQADEESDEPDSRRDDRTGRPLRG